MCQPLRISLYIPWWGIPRNSIGTNPFYRSTARRCMTPESPGTNTKSRVLLVTSFLPVTMTVESKMASPDLLSYGFSVIVALGGVIGYAKAGWCLLNCFWFFKAYNDRITKFQLAAATVHMCNKYYATVGHRLKTLGFMRCFTEEEIFSVCIRLLYIE